MEKLITIAFLLVVTVPTIALVIYMDRFNQSQENLAMCENILLRKGRNALPVPVP